MMWEINNSNEFCCLPNKKFLRFMIHWDGAGTKPRDILYQRRALLTLVMQKEVEADEGGDSPRIGGEKRQFNEFKEWLLMKNI